MTDINRPDFEKLFAAEPADPDDDLAPYNLTPRVAAALWVSGNAFLADAAYDDIEENGDAPVNPDIDWQLFDRLPTITWRQDSTWRRQMARSFEYLANDLARGEWPEPHNPAEEMALHLMLEEAVDVDTVDYLTVKAEWFKALPAYPIDTQVMEDASEALFQDHDILMLFDLDLDGIETPGGAENEYLTMGDYRPNAWFTSFNSHADDPRDGRRPFRR